MFKIFKSQKNKSQDDAQEFANALTVEASMPDIQFKKALKTRVMRTSSSNSFINFEFMKSIKFANSFALLSVVLAIIAIAGYQYVRPVPQAVLDNRKILSEVIRNNPQTILQSNVSSPTLLNFNDSQESTGTSQKMPANYSSGFNVYTHTKTTIERGPAKLNCTFYGEVTPEEEEIYNPKFAVYENYNYNGAPNEFTYNDKSITYDKDGKIVYYNLSKSFETYEYQGGEFAIKVVYPKYEINTADAQAEIDMANSKMPVEEPTEPDFDTRIELMFGKDAKVEEIVEGGKKYYLITSSHKDSCSISYSDYLNFEDDEESANTDKVIVQNIIDPDTFEIVRTERYLNEIGEENLIDKSVSEFEEGTGDFAKSEDKFNFDLDVNIKEVVLKKTTNADIVNFQEDIFNEIKEYLKDNEFNILAPADNNLSLSGNFYVPSISNKLAPEVKTINIYRASREFYPNNERGDTLFDLNKKGITESNHYEQVMTYNFTGETNNINNINVTMFSDEVDYEKVRKDLLTVYNENSVDGERTEKFEQDISVTIDSKKIPAKSYTTKFISPIYEYNDENDDRKIIPGKFEEYFYSSATILVEYDGNKFSLNISLSGDVGEMKASDIEKFLVFKSYNTSIEKDYDELLVMMQKQFDAYIAQIEAGHTELLANGELD